MKKASRKFEIASSTLRSGYKIYKSEGNYLARKVSGKKGRVNSEEIVKYVSINSEFILPEMAAHFGMNALVALYWLRKLGDIYKKAYIYVEGNEEKRNAYQENIEAISSILYTLMKSGIESSDICQNRGWGQKERGSYW